MCNSLEVIIATTDVVKWLPYSKTVGGKKSLANLANYNNLPSFLPVFTISITFPMQMGFNSPKFYPSYSPYSPNFRKFFTIR